MTTKMNTSIPHLQGAQTVDLGQAIPRKNSETDGQVEWVSELWESPTGVARTGIWQASPGSFRGARVDALEVCYIISGSATIVSDDGQETRVEPGSLFALPIGWTGTWHVHSTIRKAYVGVTEA
jgi:uncharacterized cupin superfamily protein